MIVACFDLEGVFLPEIWIEISKLTGIEKLSLTTRDIPNYQDLMKGRLKILKDHDITFDKFNEVVEKIEPVEGAREFLDWARSVCQVVILSDTFYELAGTLIAKLGNPTLFCHHLTVEKGLITRIHLRQEKPKESAVKAFKSLNFKTFACGDSFNDIGMIQEADKGCFFRAPENVLSQHPEFAHFTEFSALKKELEEIIKKENKPT